MEATDPIIRIEMARSDAAFIHDVLMSCEFRGAQMLQASGIIAGLRPALAPRAPSNPPPAGEAKGYVTGETDAPKPEPATPPKFPGAQTLEFPTKKRPAKRKR